MSRLVHEIWEETTDDGMILHSCCLAGVLGAECRKSLAPNARLLSTFEAGSHFEAMTIYHEYLDREKYTTIYEQDYLPYPREWADKQ
jgi:hypothetical protein